MSMVLRNARGRDVQVRDVTRDDLRGLADRVTAKMRGIDDVTGVIVIGSLVDSTPDELSDLDLRIFGSDPTTTTQSIEAALDRMGGKRDDDGASIHFPLDYPARLIDGLYVQFTVSRLAETTVQIEDVLAGKRLDDGLIHSLQVGEILFDRDESLRELKEYVRSLRYPQAYRDWLVSVTLDCPMKILTQAVARQDWYQAMSWLTRVFCDCAYLAFARNSRFFPGYKRLLSQTIPALDDVPDGFVEFWQQILSAGVADWEEALDRLHEFARELKDMR